MSRQPWSIPTRSELWHVLIGVGVGFVLALALFSIGGRNGLFGAFFIMLTVIPLAVFLINAVTWFHEDKVEQKERQRKLAEEIYWLKDANRAATNKPRGLIWMGRHPRRR
jgi:high-affinity Fe2+/Pb2+ permease